MGKRFLKFKQSKQTQQGFTIVELVIVVVVIAILSVIIIVAYNGIRDRAYNNVVTANVRAYVQALAMYQQEYGTEVGFPETDSCIGKGGDGEHCATVRYVGAGCGQDDGVVIPSLSVGWEQAFDDVVSPYLGQQPKNVAPTPYSYRVAAGQDCSLEYTSTAPIYQAVSSVTVGADGRATVSVSCSSQNGQLRCDHDTFVIVFRFAGNAPCPSLSGFAQSFRANDFFGNACIATSGDIIRQ